MPDTLYSLYESENNLNRLADNFNQFYTQWFIEKCEKYSGEELSNFFDIFFSRFVAYNSLYSTYTNLLEQFGTIRKKINNKNEVIERGDKEMAIDIISKRLSQNYLDSFFSKKETQESISLIIEIIEKEKFTIIHKHGEPQIKDDKELLYFLKSPNKKIKMKALLKLLYNIRCNMFHGSKSFEAEQKFLLSPINTILFEVIEITYLSFKTKVEELRLTLGKSILLEEGKIKSANGN